MSNQDRSISKRNGFELLLKKFPVRNSKKWVIQRKNEFEACAGLKRLIPFSGTISLFASENPAPCLQSMQINIAQDPEKALIEVGPSLLSFEVPSNWPVSQAESHEIRRIQRAPRGSLPRRHLAHLRGTCGVSEIKLYLRVLDSNSRLMSSTKWLPFSLETVGEAWGGITVAWPLIGHHAS